MELVARDAQLVRPKPRLHRVSDAYYILECEADGMHFHASRVARNKYGELRCTLEIRSALVATPLVDEKGLVLNRYDNVNLSAPGTRKSIGADLARSSKTGNQINWHALLDALAFQVGQEEQNGQPAVLLSRIDRPTADPLFDIDGFKLLRKHPTILFGDGGSMKSYLALHWAGRLSQMKHKVGYADWELDGGDHRERSERLFGESVPDVVYIRCARPLIYEIDRLVQVKHDYALDYMVFDSIAFACHGKPEDAEVATSYLRAIRQLEIGSLHIAHITKGENGDQRPFGSTFWHNGARSTWFAKAETASDLSGNSNSRTIGLFHRKVNVGAFQPSTGFQFDFQGERTLVKRVDVASVQALAGDVPIWQRIRHAVRRGPMPIAELAAELDENVESVAKAVKRKSNVFTLINSGDGTKKVALLERRVS